MKNKFNAIALKSRLFAEQATVFTYRADDVSIRTTLGEEVLEETYDGKTVRAEIFNALDQAKIPYAVIAAEENVVSIAVPRSRKTEAQEAIEAGKAFRMAVRFSMTTEAYDSLAPLKNALLKPFSAVRRDVARQLKRLGA